MGDDEEMVMTLKQIKMFTQLCIAVDIDLVRKVQAEINRMETLTPIYDPTWFNKNMDNLSDYKELVDAFAKFRESLQKVLA